MRTATLHHLTYRIKPLSITTTSTNKNEPFNIINYTDENNDGCLEISEQHNTTNFD